MAEKKSGMTKIHPKMTTIQKQSGGKKEPGGKKESTSSNKVRLMPKIEKKKFKRFSFIGLGRTEKGRTPKSPGVPFERGSIGLRKTKRKPPSRGGGRR